MSQACKTIEVSPVKIPTMGPHAYPPMSENPVTEAEKPALIRLATDNGIFYKMGQLAPEKKLISAPTAGKGATCISCAHCTWMAMNNLKNLANILEMGFNEIHLDKDVRKRPLRSTQRMQVFFPV